MIKRGLQIPEFPTNTAGLLDELTATARAAEDAGFDSIWVMDHLHQITARTGDPMLEGYTVLGALAARTQRAQLGSLVSAVTHRNPAILAKTVTTLDVLSGGRAILGIGGSWNQAEQRAHGIDFPGARERLDRMEEAIHICKAMFAPGPAAFTGTYYRVDGALNEPKPVRGDIPLMIGGGGEKRTLRIVAELADACNVFGDEPTLRHKMAVLDEHCAAVGRDPKRIARTTLRTMVLGHTPEEAARKGAQLRARWGLPQASYDAITIEGTFDVAVERLAGLQDAGMDGVIVNLPDPHDLEIVALAGHALAQVF